MDQSFPPFHISAVLARFCSFSYPANHQPSEIQTFHETLFNFSSIPLRVDNCYTFREAAMLLAKVARRVLCVQLSCRSLPSLSQAFGLSHNHGINVPFSRDKFTLIREIVRCKKMPRTIENCLARLRGSFIIQLEKY